jgi:hypothetical protein
MSKLLDAVGKVGHLLGELVPLGPGAGEGSDVVDVAISRSRQRLKSASTLSEYVSCGSGVLSAGGVGSAGVTGAGGGLLAQAVKLSASATSSDRVCSGPVFSFGDGFIFRPLQ